MKISVAHDFICPWCWIGLFQAKRLIAEEGVEIDWVGYELFPDELEWPHYSPVVDPPANKPATPSRLDFLYAVEGMTAPTATRPYHMRTHNAHEAVEFAKRHGVGFEFCEALYRAYWEEGQEINNIDVLKSIGRRFELDVQKLATSIREKKFKDQIVGFDDDAHKKGIYNVPTFHIGDERLAEQPYAALKRAIDQEKANPIQPVYRHVEFPNSPADRPYVFIDMVATIDGKIVSGRVDESVIDLGSRNDHAAMKRLEAAADATIIGAGTLRTSAKTWSPRSKYRVVITRSGRLDFDHGFLKGPGAIIATNGSATIPNRHGVELIRSGNEELDLELLLEKLKFRGVSRVLILGGSETNAAFLERDLVDEVFVTIAPKIKLGRDLPTLAGGEALSRNSMLGFQMVEHHVVGDEVFLRYRRTRVAASLAEEFKSA